MPMDAQLAVRKCCQGQRAGGGGLYHLAVMHDQYQARCKLIGGDRLTDTKMLVQATARTTFGSF